MALDHDHNFGDFEFAENPDAAAWLVESLTTFGENVGSIIPAGFDAYARIFHPAYRQDGLAEVPVRWGEIAAANGRVMHAEAQFEAITGFFEPWKASQPGLWDDSPQDGEFPDELPGPLVDVLQRHTTSPDRCWFCIWEGWGGLRVPNQYETRITLPGRKYLLAGGPITAVLSRFRKLSSIREHEGAVPKFEKDFTPSIWWSDDRAWCVATEIDFMWTHVGGSQALIDEILAHPEFEALPADIEHGVTVYSDPINPLPPERA